jgi:1-acyl-sn-glycerol-3-phosphate acyltransferase
MSREPVYTTAIVIGRALFQSLNLRRRVRGIENLPRSGGAVLAITHFGYLDFALTEWATHRSTGRKIRYLATAKSFKHPVAGPLMRAMKHIPVDREDGMSAYRKSLQVLKEGELLGVFPEARVNTSWTLGEIKAGAVRMAAAAGVPLIPVVLWGSHRVLTRDHRFQLHKAWGSPVLISFGEAMRPRRRDAAETAVELRNKLAAMLDEVQRDYPLRPAPGSDPWWLPAHLGGTAPPPVMSTASGETAGRTS